MFVKPMVLLKVLIQGHAHCLPAYTKSLRLAEPLAQCYQSSHTIIDKNMPMVDPLS